MYGIKYLPATGNEGSTIWTSSQASIHRFGICRAVQLIKAFHAVAVPCKNTVVFETTDQGVACWQEKYLKIKE